LFFPSPITFATRVENAILETGWNELLEVRKLVRINGPRMRQKRSPKKGFGA